MKHNEIEEMNSVEDEIKEMKLKQDEMNSAEDEEDEMNSAEDKEDEMNSAEDEVKNTGKPSKLWEATRIVSLVLTVALVLSTQILAARRTESKLQDISEKLVVQDVQSYIDSKKLVVGDDSYEVNNVLVSKENEDCLFYVDLELTTDQAGFETVPALVSFRLEDVTKDGTKNTDVDFRKVDMEILEAVGVTTYLTNLYPMQVAKTFSEPVYVNIEMIDGSRFEVKVSEDVDFKEESCVLISDCFADGRRFVYTSDEITNDDKIDVHRFDIEIQGNAEGKDDASSKVSEGNSDAISSSEASAEGDSSASEVPVVE